MEIALTDTAVKARLRILISILFIEYLIIFFSGISFTRLSGYSLFSIGVDPFFWLVYMAKIPQTILNNTWLAVLCDAGIIVAFMALIYDPLKNKIAVLLFCLLLVFYMTYMGLIGTRNYMTGFFLVLVPFLFRATKNRQIAFETLRYFLLFFYMTAAIIKVQQSAVFGLHYFSNILINQLTPYFLEHNFSARTSVNIYLIGHPSVARILFLCGSVLEFIPFIGFFTKRYDAQLAILILLFHFTNWFIMDIAPIGQIAFICTLFFSRKFEWKSSVL